MLYYSLHLHDSVIFRIWGLSLLFTGDFSLWLISIVSYITFTKIFGDFNVNSDDPYNTPVSWFTSFFIFFLLYHLNHPFPWLYASLVITSNVSSPKSQFQSSFPLNTSFWLSCSHLLEEPPQFFHPIMTINFLIQSTLLPNITTHPCFLYYPDLLV